MKTLEKILVGLLLVLIGAAVSFLITFEVLNSRYAARMEALMDGSVVKKASEVESYLDAFFVEEPDKAFMADAAASAMVASIGDEWSYYIPVDQYDDYLESANNEFVGIGTVISQEPDLSGIVVEEVMAGGPAEETGFQVGDKMIAVDGMSIAGMAVSEVRELIRGPEGTTVDITILRGGEELVLTVERRTIKNVVASAKLMEGNVGYIMITNFDLNCANQTIACIEDMLAQGAESLLFDVRNNGGGYRAELVELLDYLLPEGEVFRMVSSSGEVTVNYSDASCVEIPMGVLVNLNSFSAAEFFAAALQEYGVAEIVGEQTYGKGRYQKTYELSDGSAIVLSSGSYYTPNGENLTGVGITPDLVVGLNAEDLIELYYHRLDPEQDEQLQAALELLRR